MRLLAHVCLRRPWIVLAAASLVIGSAVQDGRAAAQNGDKTYINSGELRCRTRSVMWGLHHASHAGLHLSPQLSMLRHPSGANASSGPYQLIE